MSRAAFTTVALSTFVLGAGLGVYIGFRFAQPRTAIDDMAQISRYATYVEIQRVNGTDAAYEEALRGFLRLITAERYDTGFGLPDRAYAFDAAMIYVRLSQLAAKRGDRAQEVALLGKATAMCPRIGWTACSESILVDATRRLDALTPFGSKAAPAHGPN